MFPILESILFTSKLYLYSNFMNEKGWNSDKKYVFGTENKSLSMEFMLTKLYNLQACILLVRPVWACPCVLRFGPSTHSFWCPGAAEASVGRCLRPESATCWWIYPELAPSWQQTKNTNNISNGIRSPKSGKIQFLAKFKF